MKILEVRDGFIKFEAASNVPLSSFIQIDDTKNSYIAQVIQVKHIGENSIVYAKILFLYNGAFNDYDNSLPSIDSEISSFDINLFHKTFKPQASIVAGSFVENNEQLLVDKECFDKKTLICIDSNEINKTVVSNLAKQFGKSLIIDTLGIFSTNKFIAGVDFKLPLNTDALQFMFEDCLNDATFDSKNLIKEIFQDLADYSRTVPFVPFGALKSIVDDMVDKSHVFKLLVLKNKLAKFDKLGYFAATSTEAENLNKILTSSQAVIDLSKLDSVFQNRYLSIILSDFGLLKSKTQVFVVASNNLDKKNLKKIVTGNLATTLATHSKFKYLNEIKSMYSNFIIEPTFTNNQIFKNYSVFLNAMQKDSYLLVGEGTNFIPFVSSVAEIKDIEVNPERIEANEEDTKVELTPNQLLELEQSLEKEDEIIDSVEISEDIASVEAIEKKSEDLIDRVSEEVLAKEIPTELNLFAEEESEEELNEDLLEDTKEETVVEETEIAEVIPETEEPTEVEILDNAEEIEEVEELNESDLEEPELINEEPAEEFHTQIDEIQTIDIPEDISELAEEAEALLEGNEIEETGVIEESTEVKEPEVLTEDTEFAEIKLRDYSEELDSQEASEVIPISSSNDEFDDIVELDESEIDEADIVVDFGDEDIEQLDEEALDKAIVEDVDKVFTTMKEDSISDSDLDFIDELNNEVQEEVEEVTLSEGMEELTELEEVDESEDNFLEPLEEVNDFSQEEVLDEKEILEKRNTSTPIVPVYGAEIPAEDTVMSDDIEQGDTVVHAKYGNGVVEKMIKYGTKTLYSINFDNVGRRLLDPTLTEIKKS